MTSSTPAESPQPVSDRAREWAFRLLYAQQIDRNAPRDLESDDHDLPYFVMADDEWEASSSTSPYIPDLRAGRLSETAWHGISEQVIDVVNGVGQHRQVIEAAIRTASPRWRLERMPAVDRTLLTIGCYELIVAHARPARRVINRTVELAKRYGEADSRRFVNGILDQIRKNNAGPAD